MAKALLYKGFIAPGLSRGLILEHEKQALAINIKTFIITDTSKKIMQYYCKK